MDKLSKLSVEFLRERYIYYPETGVFWSKRLRRPCGHMTFEGYLRIAINHDGFQLHRIIWKWMTGENPPPLIDHRNGVKSDNRWDNLRAATKAQNGHNRRKIASNNTSGATGVMWNGQLNRWTALIKYDDKPIYLGSYADKNDAIQARQEAVKKYYGEFAGAYS